jgi:hypothetical protein
VTIHTQEICLNGMVFGLESLHVVMVWVRTLLIKSSPELHLGCVYLMSSLVNTCTLTVADRSQYVLLVNRSYDPITLWPLVHAVQYGSAWVMLHGKPLPAHLSHYLCIPITKCVNKMSVYSFVFIFAHDVGIFFLNRESNLLSVTAAQTVGCVHMEQSRFQPMFMQYVMFFTHSE